MCLQLVANLARLNAYGFFVEEEVVVGCACACCGFPCLSFAWIIESEPVQWRPALGDDSDGANYFLLFLALITIYACYAVRALRWQRFQAHVGPARFWNIYPMTLAGFSALFLLGRAAEPVRPLLIARKDKLPVADTFGIYALERILDGASTAVLAAIGLLIFESLRST